VSLGVTLALTLALGAQTVSAAAAPYTVDRAAFALDPFTLTAVGGDYGSGTMTDIAHGISCTWDGTLGMSGSCYHTAGPGTSYAITSASAISRPMIPGGSVC
jgi:hypothetical protein